MNRRQRKILVVVGTRPEAIKLAMVVRRLGASPDVTTELCLTGQHDELVRSALEIFGLTPTRELAVRADVDVGLAGLTARIVTGIAAVLRETRPDRVVVQGDTTTAFAASLAAFYEGTPVAHVEAGLRTGSLRAPWPEEANRRMIGVLADRHFAPTTAARQALLDEGVDDERITVTGNTGIDALHFVVDQIASDDALRETLDARFSFVPPDRRLILVTNHRRESLGRPLEEVCHALVAVLRSRPDVHVLWPVHPNPRVEGSVRRILGGASDVRDRLHLVSPTDYRGFVYLMRRATLVITDSGGIQEEAPSLGLPALVTRTSTDRAEAVEAGAARLVGTNRAAIVRETQVLLDDPDQLGAMSQVRPIFGDGRASARIVTALTRGVEAPSRP